MNLTGIYENIKIELKAVLSEKRFKHSLNVEVEAVRLAEIYGCDAEKTRLSAIAHDFAKAFSDMDLIKMAKTHKLIIDEIQYNFPQLLHGPVAAEIIKEKYKIYDNDILNAISYHTTGRVDMSTLEKIIFLADVIEPGRNFPGINAIREMAPKDINRALLMACNYTLVYITEKNYLIHPLTIQFRNNLILKGGDFNE